MSETVSSTTDFNLPVDEIIEEAWDHVKDEYTSGYDTRSARRSLNLLLRDIQSRGYAFFQLEQRTLSLVIGQRTYDLPSDVVEIMDLNNVTTDGVESQTDRMALLDYFNLSTKDNEGAFITSYAFDKTVSPSKLHIYPTPNASAGTLKYWAVKKPRDVTASYQLLSMSDKYLPAITMGLAYFMGLKKANFPLDRLAVLKGEYEERLLRAFDSDAEAADFVVYPSVMDR